MPMPKKFRFLTPVFILALVAGGFLLFHGADNQPVSNTGHPASKSGTPAATIGSFDKRQYSLTDPTSIWVVVNKHRQLSPKNYAPADLTVPDVALRAPGDSSMQVRQVTAKALESLFAGAQQNGTPLRLSSGYRSYSFQVSLYGSYVQQMGQAGADKQSARPGYSEHQTGLAADVEPLDESCHLDICFADTPAGKWVAANAYKYGFIIRYQQDDTGITGYQYEPWHVRYIGIPLATELHQRNVKTLEQFFDLGAAPDYQ